MKWWGLDKYCLQEVKSRKVCKFHGSTVEQEKSGFEEVDQQERMGGQVESSGNRKSEGVSGRACGAASAI